MCCRAAVPLLRSAPDTIAGRAPRYLKGFKWNQLTEKISYERTNRENKIRTEMAQVHTPAPSFVPCSCSARPAARRRAPRVPTKAVPKLACVCVCVSGETQCEVLHEESGPSQGHQLHVQSKGPHTHMPRVPSSSPRVLSFSANMLHNNRESAARRRNHSGCGTSNKVWSPLSFPCLLVLSPSPYLSLHRSLFLSPSSPRALLQLVHSNVCYMYRALGRYRMTRTTLGHVLVISRWSFGADAALISRSRRFELFQH